MCLLISRVIGKPGRYKLVVTASLKFFMNRNPYSCSVYNLGYRLLGVPVVGEKGNLSSPCML